jgi:hypothetical protein
VISRLTFIPTIFISKLFLKQSFMHQYNLKYRTRTFNCKYVLKKRIK